MTTFVTLEDLADRKAKLLAEQQDLRDEVHALNKQGRAVLGEIEQIDYQMRVWTNPLADGELVPPPTPPRCA